MMNDYNANRIAAMTQVIEYMVEGIRAVAVGNDPNLEVAASSELLATMQPICVDSSA